MKGRRRILLAIIGVVAAAAVIVLLSPALRPGEERVMRVAFGSDIPSIDPAVAANERSLAVERLVFEQLLGYDRETTLIPLLAEAMPDVSADGLRYTFHLRRGVWFVGTDGKVVRGLTSADVLATFDRLLDPGLKPAPFPEASTLFTDIVGAADVVAGRSAHVSGIKALDERTVEFDLIEPDATFDYRLATGFASIVPPELAGRDTTAFSAAPVGTGPYLFAGSQAGVSMTFVHNPHYWQAGQPGADRVDIALGVDPAVEVERVQAGDLDIAGSGIPPGSFAAVVNDPRWQAQVHKRIVMETQYLSLDTQSDGPLSDVRVRRAIESAIDRDNIITIVQGRGQVAKCIFPPELTAYDPTCDPYPYDQDLARRLLADAGYADGFDTKIFVVNEDPDPLIGESIQQDLAAIGIRAEVVPEEFSTWLDSIRTPGRAPMSYAGWNVDYPDPANFIDPILSCASVIPDGENYARYCDTPVDALAAGARAEQDPTKRIADYREVERRIMDDAPWVPIRFPVRATIVSTRMAGFYFHPIWGYDLRGYAVGR